LLLYLYKYILEYINNSSLSNWKKKATFSA
jgi:hypothetical protein